MPPGLRSAFPTESTTLSYVLLTVHGLLVTLSRLLLLNIFPLRGQEIEAVAFAFY